MRALSKFVQLAENVTSTYHGRRCKQRLVHLSHKRFKATLIDGVKIANAVLDHLSREVLLLQEKAFQAPQLTTVLVGNNEASHLYIERKLMAAKSVGISTNIIHLDDSIEETQLLSLIHSLNNDETVHGILVQLPLPVHLSERTISNVIAPEKDVDGFSFSNIGRFVLNMDALWPCTALAVQHLIHSTGIKTKGKHAVVCGRSKNVGLPIAMVLQGGVSGLDASTTICHRYTPHDLLCQLTRSADILVSATGVPGLITSSMVKPGACVIDVGITRVFDTCSQKQRVVGDIKFDEVCEVAGFLTPVPGGVGPMTVAMLLKNTLKAARYQMKASF